LRKLIKARLQRLSRPRQAFDSTTVSAIPRSAKAAFGYIGGSWPTYENGELKRRVPLARKVSIAVASRYDADMLDVEPGDAAVADCPNWFRRQLAKPKKKLRRRRKPKFYGSVSSIDGIVEGLAAAGHHRDEFRLLSAHVGAGKHICGPKTCGETKYECDGTQFDWTARGRNLDESVLKPSFWD
jgi:hypothetical protein